MREHRPFATHLSPLLIRVALGVTFLWAGLAKWAGMQQFSPSEAAFLANSGFTVSPQQPAPIPIAPLPAASQAPGEQQALGNAAFAYQVVAYLANPEASALVATPASSQPAPAPAPQTQPQNGTQPDQDQNAIPQFTAEDFPNGAKLRKFHSIALMIESAAHPKPQPDGSDTPSLWPEAMARGPWLVTMAYTAMLSEIITGVFLLLGFLTRLSGMTVAGIMVTAYLLAVLAPTLAQGPAMLGFLPRWGPFADEWQVPLWQLALFAGGVSLLFTGPGKISADGLLFGRGHHDVNDSDDDD